MNGMKQYFWNVVVGIFIVLGQITTVHGSTVWHWEDHFTPPEKAKIETWLKDVTNAVEATLGNYPFDVHYYLHRKDYASEPVPWAHTSRHFEQAVHFYVDPSYSLKAFLEDWTAPHEISHLSIPFIGKENSWFAEGYATYLQVQVMKTMGYYTEETAKKKYTSKYAMVKEAYQKSIPFVATAKNLKKQNKYPQMYWGSVHFFRELDKKYSESGSSLLTLLNRYLECCRLNTIPPDLKGILQAWDQLHGSNRGMELLHHFETTSAKEIMK